MYNYCVYLTNRVSGMSVCVCEIALGRRDLVLIDGFRAHVGNRFKPLSGESN